MSSDELNHYVRQVMGQPSREARKATLETVPGHIRQKVEARVRHEWEKRKRVRRA